MLRHQNDPMCCQNGWSGPLPPGRGTVSDATCGPRSGAVRTSRNNLSRILCCTLFISLLLIAPAFSAGQANVFVYHRFDDSRYPSTNISTQDFRAHLDILRENSFQVLTLGEVVARLKGGTGLPQRCAVITIDDAYQSFLTAGWPLLKKYGYPATLFVSTDSVAGGDYLSWAELRQLREEGVELGNHSAAHAYMLDDMDDADWTEQVNADLARSRQAFRDNLGFDPELFAYPYGEFSPELATLVEKAGFIAAFGQQSGVVSAGQEMYSLPRFPMGAGFAAAESFRSKLFMRHLPVNVLSLKSPVLAQERRPDLSFYINSSDIAESTLKCYVPGQPVCVVEEVEGRDNLYQVRAVQPLEGRRSKYTVTASDRKGQTWYWFSQLLVWPKRGAMPDDPVAR